MSAFQRWLVWGSSVATGVTGVVYWWMKNMMETADPWAVINHPLQPWVLKAHILVAPLMVFAVGLITSQHVWRHYRCGARTGRRSGLTSMWAFAPAVITGYLIQALTDATWLKAMALAHLATGLLFLVGLVAHHPWARGWRGPRRNGGARRSDA